MVEPLSTIIALYGSTSVLQGAVEGKLHPQQFRKVP